LKIYSELIEEMFNIIMTCMELMSDS